MCSILGILEIQDGVQELRDAALELSRKQRHRGPDWSGVYSAPHAILCHERLAIVDVLHGAQPLQNADGTVALAVNGEIYNHKDLKNTLEYEYAFQTDSDCEVIIPLWQEREADSLNQLNGIFAFVLYDSQRDYYVIARDPIGVIPLYMGRDEQGHLFVASEMKALTDACKTVEEFPPGHYLDSRKGADPIRYFNPAWREYEAVSGKSAETQDIRTALESAIHRQLMSDVPFGVLLSGGLDSSIVAAVAAKFAQKRVEDDDRTDAWWPRLHSFAIGLEGAPDLKPAKEMADHIGTVHHEFHFTMQEGLDALRDVIYHLETFDVTTVRASTPMYLLARRIRAMGIKMVLSGEGADEIFGGYLYFHRAPDARAFHEETVRKIDRLHKFDCLRANKSMAAWGIEARVPFLDLRFLDTAMAIDPSAKMSGNGKIEKQILRDAFHDILPAAIHGRQKEQFSDGVGYSWIDGLRDYAEDRVSDRDLQNAKFRFPKNTPDSKEAFLYRAIFEEHYPLPSQAACVMGGPSVACSTPEALAWDESLGAVTDPSGRSVRGVHQDSY